jgi:uncharacterized Zn-finger protein
MHNITLPSISSNLPLQNLSILYLAPMLTASTRLKFQCKTCHKQFSRKSSYKRHIKIHTKVKEYSCKVCNKSFGRKDILVKHRESRKCKYNSLPYNSSISENNHLEISLSDANSPISTSSSYHSPTADIRMSISWLLSDSSGF